MLFISLFYGFYSLLKSRRKFSFYNLKIKNEK